MVTHVASGSSSRPPPPRLYNDRAAARKREVALLQLRFLLPRERDSGAYITTPARARQSTSALLATIVVVLPIAATIPASHRSQDTGLYKPPHEGMRRVQGDARRRLLQMLHHTAPLSIQTTRRAELDAAKKQTLVYTHTRARKTCTFTTTAGRGRRRLAEKEKAHECLRQ